MTSDAHLFAVIRESDATGWGDAVQGFALIQIAVEENGNGFSPAASFEGFKGFGFFCRQIVKVKFTFR